MKANGVSERALARAIELAGVAFGGRRAHSALSAAGNAFKVALLVFFGLLLAFAVAPLVSYAAIAAKQDWVGLPQAMSSYIESGGGWGMVHAVGDPKAGAVEAATLAVAAFLWTSMALYAFVGMRRSWKRNIFGGKAPVSGGDSKGDARVETSDVVLAATTRVWKPGKPLEHAGLVLGYSPFLHRYYLSGEEEHTQLIAPPGVGKTTRAVYPTLHAVMCSQDSAIVFDPKGELYDNTSAAAREGGADVVVIDYSNWRRSDLYNPLHEVARAYFDSVAGVDAAEAAGDLVAARNHRIEAMSRADARAQDLAEAIIPDKQGNDHFWRPSARTLARAMFLLVGTYRPCDWLGGGDPPCEPASDQRTLKTVRHLLDVFGKPRKRKVGSSVEDYVPLEDLFLGLSEDHPARKAFAQAKNSPNTTLGGIISTLLQVIDAMVSEESNMMSYGMDFEFESIGTRRTFVYLIVPEERPASFAYLPVFTVQAYQGFARLARRNGGRMPRNVHFVCEEMGNTPEVPRLANMVGTGRGYGIRFHFVMQNPYQWSVEYADAVSASLTTSLNTTLFLKVNDNKTAKDLSEAIGNATVPVESRGASSPAGFLSFGTSQTTTSYQEVPLVPPSKILQWDPLWGSFCRRSQITRNGMLNRLFFHRHESCVTLYPTTRPKYLPTMKAFGIDRKRRAAERVAGARSIDKSAARRIVPPWSASRTRLAATLRRTCFAAEVEALACGRGSDATEAMSEERGRIRRETALANRLCQAMEAAAGLSAPWSYEDEAFKARRTSARNEWMAAFGAALEADGRKDA